MFDFKYLAVYVFPDAAKSSGVPSKTTLPPKSPGFRTKFDNPVRGTDDIHIVLDHDYGMAFRQKGVEGFQQPLHIIEMKTGGRLIENEQYPAGIGTD